MFFFPIYIYIYIAHTTYINIQLQSCKRCCWFFKVPTQTGFQPIFVRPWWDGPQNRCPACWRAGPPLHPLLAWTWWRSSWVAWRAWRFGSDLCPFSQHTLLKSSEWKLQRPLFGPQLWIQAWSFLRANLDPFSQMRIHIEFRGMRPCFETDW